ncbi:large ribosomal subunit protein uL10-like [Lycium barbarum]|uniref:large ribosomal subunit protein uL10-like n=1 Tax=Lycium barbarum TaxID=112863 RepID=UPI00293F6ADB|nr:large ribosomal subunit protein uL10-like [Lycium barbarum]
MKFAAGLTNVVGLSMILDYPTLTAIPHMFINSYKNVLSFAVATEYSFPQAEKVKQYLKDPSKFAAPAASAKAAPAKEEKKEEPEEEDDDLVGGLFD